MESAEQVGRSRYSPRIKGTSLSAVNKSISANSLRDQSISEDQISNFCDRSRGDQSPSQQRRRFRNRKNTSTFEDFVILGSGSAAGNLKSEGYQRNVHSTDVDKPRIASATSSSAIADASATYGVANQEQLSTRPTSRRESHEKSMKPRNYHIKAIRRGIPEIISTNPLGQQSRIPPKEVEITTYCVCQKNSKRKRNAMAWTFSSFTALICIICPMFSFFCDVAFYVTCTDHYNETAKLLEQARKLNFSTLAATMDATAIRQLIINQEKIDEQKAIPLRQTRETSSLLDKDEIYFSSLGAVRFSGLKINERTNHISSSDIGIKKEVSKRHVHSKPGRAIRHAKSNLAHLKTNGFVATNETDQDSVPVCYNASTILKYMQSKDAKNNLTAHKHVTEDIFEPVFIIGTFPSLVLCILTRLIVMITGHDHFLSTFVTNMVTMPLQLVTGALSAHSAAYHLGPYGFECWSCAVLKGDCSNVNALSWMYDSVTVSLMVAIVAKIIDGMAGGSMIFVVLMRKLWQKEGQRGVWWYCIRYVLTGVYLILCLTIPTSMVITPATGVFRLELLEKTAMFAGRDQILVTLMIVLGIGVVAWGVTFSTLLIYLVYKTCLYCRIKEHAADMLDP